jgi:septum formation protein
MRKGTVLLASKSPRRKKLLRKLLPSSRIEVLYSEIPENRQKYERVDAFCKRIAGKKVAVAWSKYGRKRSNVTAVVGADTVVRLRGQIIGQPKDCEDAVRILNKLSGQSHEVITGVAVFSPSSNRFATFVVKSKVWMRKLSPGMIQEYVAIGESLGKAGAYAIQGKGRKLVARYEGSYSNIVGLPVNELKAVLKYLK